MWCDLQSDAAIPTEQQMPLYTINFGKVQQRKARILHPFATQWAGSAEYKDVWVTPSVCTGDSRCSEFRPFVIAHFNTNVSTSRDWFQWIETMWLANRPLPLSSVKLCHLLSAVDRSVLYGIWFCFYHWMYFTLSNVFAVTSILCAMFGSFLLLRL